jgi:cytochrome b involved in lipid metabolism
VDEAKLPSFTPAEVSKHASQTDLWVIIDGKVYDLTRYVSTHPGGLDIMKNAGGDASVGFHGLQHPEHVFATVKKFVIGTLEA